MLGRAEDFLQVGMERVIGGGPFQGELGVAEDHRQHVVELVGHAAGQQADGLHLLCLAELFLHLAELGDVIDDGVEHGPPLDVDGARVHGHVAHRAVRPAVAELEVDALMPPRPRHLLLDLCGAEGVDLVDAHPLQLFPGPAVEGGRRLVGLEDAAVVRVDEQLDRGVPLEQGAELGLALAQGLLHLLALGDHLGEQYRAADGVRRLVPGVHGPAHPFAPAIPAEKLVLLAALDGALQAALVHFPPAIGDLGEHLVMVEADEVPLAQVVVGQEAAAHRQVAHLPVEHGDGRRRLIDKQAEQQPLPAHGLAQGVTLADVAEHEHHPEQFAVRGEDGRGRIGNVAALAVPGDEGDVVGQGHRGPAGEHLLHRARHRLAGAAVLEHEHPVKRLAFCRRSRPAGEGRRRRVDQGHPAGRIRGHDPVADGLEDDGPVLEHGAGLGRGIEQGPVVRPLPALPGDERSTADQGGQGGEQAEQQEDAAAAVGKGLVRVDLGHQEPGRVRNGQDHRLDRRAAVVPAVHVALAPLHGHDRDQFSLAQRLTQGEGHVRPVAGVHQEEHSLAVPAHEQGFRGTAGDRPLLELGEEEGGGVTEEQEAAERTLPLAGRSVEGHDDGRVRHLPGVRMQVDEHRVALSQGPLHKGAQPGGVVLRCRAEAQPLPALPVHQADVAEAMLLGEKGPSPEEFPAVVPARRCQEAFDGVDQVRVAHEAGAVGQLVVVPVGDLRGLEQGDGREFPFHLGAHPFRLHAVDPDPAGHQGQHHRRGRDQGPPEPGPVRSGRANAVTPEGRIGTGGRLGLRRFSGHDCAPPAWSSLFFVRRRNPAGSSGLRPPHLLSPARPHRCDRDLAGWQ